MNDAIQFPLDVEPDDNEGRVSNVVQFHRPRLLVMTPEETERYCENSVKADEIRWSL